MVNRFTVNGQTYAAKPFTFKMMVDLNKLGIPLAKIGNMDVALLNAYFSICAGVDEDEAAELIEQHIINGGSLNEISEVVSKEMDESDFFRSISNRESEGTETDGTENPASGDAEKKRGRKPSVE